MIGVIVLYTIIGLGTSLVRGIWLAENTILDTDEIVARAVVTGILGPLFALYYSFVFISSAAKFMTSGFKKMIASKFDGIPKAQVHKLSSFERMQKIIRINKEK